MATPRRNRPEPSPYSDFVWTPTAGPDPIIASIKCKPNISDALIHMPEADQVNAIKSLNDWVVGAGPYLKPVNRPSDISVTMLFAVLGYAGHNACLVCGIERELYDRLNIAVAEAVNQLRAISKPSVKGANMANMLMSAQAR